MRRVIGETLIVLVLGLAAALAANALRPASLPLGSDPRALLVDSAVPLLDVTGARAAFDAGAVFIDARATESFARGHIEGALSLPPNGFEAAYREWWEFIPADAQVVVYAGAHEPRISGVRADWLVERGHESVAVFFDGWEAWRGAGFPQATGGE